MKQLKQLQYYFVSEFHYCKSCHWKCIKNSFCSFWILSKRCLSLKTQFKIEFSLPGTSRRNVFEIMPDFGTKIPLLLVSQKMAIQQKQPHTCFCVFIMSHRIKLHSVRAKSQGIPCSKQMQYLKFKKTATGLEPTTT